MAWSPSKSEGKLRFKRSFKINSFRNFSYAVMENLHFRAASWAESYAMRVGDFVSEYNFL